MANAQLIAEDVMRAQANEEASTNLGMEAPVYEQKLIKVLTLVGMAEVAIRDYIPDDVEIHNVADGEFRRQLEGTRAKYEQAQAEICDVLARLNDSDIDRQRTRNLYFLQTDLQTKWKKNSIGVRRKAFSLRDTAATRQQKIAEL